MNHLVLWALLEAKTTSSGSGTDWFTVLVGASHIAYLLALLSIPSVLMQRRGRPQAALTWVLLLFLLPYGLGLFFWWAIGRTHLKGRRRKKRQSTRLLLQRLAKYHRKLPHPPDAEWGLLPIERFPREEAEWILTPTADNRVRLLVNAAEAYPAMERIIREAKHHLHLLFYIWQADETGRRFRDLLIEKARQGIKVRLLYDAVGGANVRFGFMDPLIEAGAEVEAFMPPRIFRRSLELNFRNHRKLVIADGEVGMLGGFNVGDEYCHDWRDTAVLLRGPALDQLQEVFADDWYFTTQRDYTSPEYFGRWINDGRAHLDGHDAACGLISSGPQTELNLTHEAFFLAITTAQKRIYLTTPYFVPDATIMHALRSAMFRGVDVRLLVPFKSDAPLVRLAGRSYYPDLLRAGVRIFEYEPMILHSKTGVFDDDLSFIGSANMDIRSFKLNFELSCFLKSRAVCQQMADIFARDVAQSREISLDEVKKNSYFARLSEAAAHLMSPLL